MGGHGHPYSPAELELPGFVPQQLSQAEVVAPYLGASLLVILAVWLISGRFGSRSLSKTDRLLMCWWAFTGLTHIVLEGPFLFTPDFFRKENPSYFDDLCEFLWRSKDHLCIESDQRAPPLFSIQSVFLCSSSACSPALEKNSRQLRLTSQINHHEHEALGGYGRSPAELELPGFVPQRLSQVEVVAPFVGTSLFVVFSIWLISGRCSRGRVSKADRLAMCWWAFIGVTHIVFEGPLVFTPDFVSKENPNYFDDLCKFLWPPQIDVPPTPMTPIAFRIKLVFDEEDGVQLKSSAKVTPDTLPGTLQSLRMKRYWLG
ncbi:hypothetical protein HU200_009684 [Digitaria exilis]|uniref:Uncharacterized protein n=1 Tax=Digitaria exilis TaxID=1010633 RepID=A0A835FIY7_9POAL|nr:hypothetical protein HU200_009684 [Digitaria exilis]